MDSSLRPWGGDTFRGTTAGSTALRQTLFQKNEGFVVAEKNGLLRVDSPISGNLLVSTTNAKHSIRDPISGTRLVYQGQSAAITAPVLKQQLVHSKKFYLERDVDVTIQTLRNTTKVTRYTNEKVGTAGTPTGMDKSLVKQGTGQDKGRC